MSKINGINGVIEVLRKKIGTTSTNQSRSTSKSPDNTSGNLSTRPRNTDELKKGISERIKDLKKDSSDFEQKATKIFLESVIAWELGEELVNDDKFDQMINDIYQSIVTNDELNNNFKLLINDLGKNQVS